MDLYSAARRLSKPFVIKSEADARELPISAHGLIGDCFSAALVRADGVIDWLCLPRFDSPSVFASLLDSERGGHMTVSPATYPFESLQRYDPETNVLETLFRVEGHGVIRLTDFMPWIDDPRLSLHEVHRRIQCVEGTVDMRIAFDPRFDYARSDPTLEVDGPATLARGTRGERIAAVLGGDGDWRRARHGGVESKFRLKAGETQWAVVSWDAERPEPIVAYRPWEMLRATRHRWREWSRQLRYDGPWRHHVMRSALVLKLLTYAPTGAMVAAPTTSLPELLGGERNWDYRYTWTRDTAMGIRAANLLGCVDEAREFFHFVRDTLEQNRALQIMYAIDGSPVPDEEILSHLQGFAGSSPVRIGNAARDQLQLDTAGALMDAAFVYERGGGSLTLRVWRRLREVVETVAQDRSKPDHGMWEPRADMRHNVHSKLMSWVALRRGAQLAPLFGDDTIRGMWEEDARRLHAELCERGMSKSGKHFVAAYDHTHPDSALLLLPTQGFLPPTDPRVLATLDWVKGELGDGPFLYRYLAHDGLAGHEGAFVLCGFWMAEALAMAGRVDEAQEVFIQHAEASNHLGLLSEEIDPKTGALLGNFPQAFSHLGLINSAARIDVALRLRDEGSHRVPDPLAEKA